MKLRPFIANLKKMPDRMNKAALKPYKAELPLILRDLQSRSPVDSGTYKGSWKIKNASTRGVVLANTVFYNDDPKAHLMEFGAAPGEAPWYYPNSKKTGKLTVSGGKVWAGGLKPGHQHTVGGAISPVLYKNNKRQLDLVNRIADSVSKRA
jgi:hypothetical protein